MLNTKNIITSISDVPVEWVYEYYLKLNVKLVGQSHQVLSPFNSNDKRPSFGLYLNKDNIYKFKDFSTGKQGDNVALVEAMFNLSSRGEAAHKIISDYINWLKNNENDFDTREKVVITSYKVTEFTKRGWTKPDEKFWTKYNIGSKILKHYNVEAIDSYKMQRHVGDEPQEIEIKSRPHTYGYFRADGTLYKIYQPYIKEMKFVKVRDYVQGTDQLTMQKKYLVICSSLKDIMAFHSLGYKDAECVAPDSENTLLADHVMNAYKLKYQSVVVLFDNDEAGIKAAKKYEEKYDIKSVQLNMSKDLSDAIRDHGVLEVLKALTPNLKQALK